MIQQPYSINIPSGDVLIHCEICGSEGAPVLVLLHGNGEDGLIFEPQIKFFSQHYKTIAVDTRGHGQSTRGTAPFNFYTFAADLVVVFDMLGIDKAQIIGFSDGAITALHLAITAPERISSMVLLGANYNPKGIRFVPRLCILAEYAWLSIASLFSADIRRRKEIWGLMVHQPNLTIEEISWITVSTVVITGENDMVSQSHNDEIARVIAGSGRITVPGGDHFWMFKDPATLHRHVMDFLQHINNDDGK